jgi:hypothetical protein
MPRQIRGAELLPSTETRPRLASGATATEQGAVFAANCRAMRKLGAAYRVNLNSEGAYAQCSAVGGEPPSNQDLDFHIPWAQIRLLEKTSLIFDPSIRVHLASPEGSDEPAVYCEFYFGDREQADDAALRIAQIFPDRLIVRPDPLYRKLVIPAAAVFGILALTAMAERAGVEVVDLGWVGALLHVVGIRSPAVLAVTSLWPLAVIIKRVRRHQRLGPRKTG